MLIKKTPVLQWYPDFEILKGHCFSRIPVKEFAPVFYDIETTGLSRSATFLYLIGAVVHEGTGWMMYQWFAENQKDEPVLLKEFSRFLASYTCTIQYNGSQFDQPYLEERYRLHDIPSPFDQMAALDLYRTLKPLKQLLKLPNMKQPALEAFLDLPARLYTDGKECISLYKQYQKSHRQEHAEILLGHNQEDLQGLGRICSILEYLNLPEGRYLPSEAIFDGECVYLTLTLESALPAPFSNGSDVFYITGESTRVRLAIKAKDGRLKLYHPNYKEYDYIPSEDMAMPKSLSSCMDKSLRRPAKADTCYTWFACTDAFLADSGQQLLYLHNTLPILLGTLK